LTRSNKKGIGFCDGGCGAVMPPGKGIGSGGIENNIFSSDPGIRGIGMIARTAYD